MVVCVILPAAREGPVGPPGWSRPVFKVRKHHEQRAVGCPAVR